MISKLVTYFGKHKTNFTSPVVKPRESRTFYGIEGGGVVAKGASHLPQTTKGKPKKRRYVSTRATILGPGGRPF